MRRQSIFKYMLVSCMLVVTFFITTAFAGKYDATIKKLSMIQEIINEYYIGEVDPYKLQEGIYKGFVAGIGDDYSRYYTKEEYDDFKRDSKGINVGIGISLFLNEKDNSIVIKEVYADSPAQKAGLLSKDIITKLDQKQITGDDYLTISDFIKDKKYIAVEIFRPSDHKYYEFKVKVSEVAYPTVNYHLMQNELMYVGITQFKESTYSQFKDVLNEVEAKKAKGLIIDLRDNPGGLLDSAVDIADELVPKGVIVSTKDKSGKTITYEADESYNDIPVVVLINHNSASASEVLSGALRDYKRAILVGETSFGKGIVQTVVPLKDGSAIKLTTSEYFTPSGICIQKVGIKPDKIVSLSKEELKRKYELEESEDVQLQEAIRVLKEQIEILG